MDVNFSKLANTGIAELEPYQIGKPISSLQRETGHADIIKLASNENPLGPSPAALDVYHHLSTDLALYPDGAAFDLKQALAQHLQVPIDTITLGNGSDNVLALAVQVFAAPGSEVLLSETGFITFTLIAKAHQAKVTYATEQAWTADVKALLAAVNDNTSVIMIANPNNPTGTWIDNDALNQLLTKVPTNIIVVIDEAYYEYMDDPNYPNTIALQQQYPNLIITRTFSKAYGLAGLRIGYAIADPKITDLLNRVRLPFNVNSTGQAAALAAISDQQHVAASVVLNKRQRSILTESLEKLGLAVIPSATNFVMVDLKQAAQPIYESLLRHGIIVRPLGPYQLPNHLRITIGLAEHNQRLLQTLAELI